jgi:hypothetical protein
MHLKTHSITSAEYLERYPGAPLISEEDRAAKRKATLRLRQDPPNECLEAIKRLVGLVVHEG